MLTGVGRVEAVRLKLLYSVSRKCLVAGIVLTALLLLAAPGVDRVMAADAPISMDIRGADIRDVLSALALKMDLNIIYTAEPVLVNFQTENTAPMEVLSILLQSQGLTYLQDGKLLVVGTQDRLSADFYQQMVLTRFNLLYVNAATVESLATKLGIPVQVVNLGENPQALWAQGIPRALQKLQELISAVDRPENTRGYAQLEYRLHIFQHMTAERAAAILADTGIQLTNYTAFGNKLMVFDNRIFPQWDELETVLNEIDYTDMNEGQIYLFALENTPAVRMQELLEEMGFDGVKAVVIHFDADFEKWSKGLLVFCPPEMEKQVRDFIQAYDTPRAKIRLPLATSTSDYRLQKLREYLGTLSGVPVSNMMIYNLDGKYILWADESPERIRQLLNLIDEINGMRSID